VSAEKWVSRTGVSAGEYHIATLWRGLQCALRVEGWYVDAHIYSYTRSYRTEGGVTPRSNRISAR